jgi:cytochrome c peroxidase
MKLQVHIILLVLLAFTACRKDADAPLPPEPLLAVPPGFPVPDFPAGNELTDARWALGKRLFYEPGLSRDSTLSCASCHLPAHAFADVQAFSPGVENRPGTRNAPSLANVAYHPYYTREGGVPTLEMQVLVPIQEHNEFDYNMVLAAQRLSRDSTYVRAAQAAYQRPPDAFVITRAIACFERTLISGRGRYDAYIQGENPAALTAEERQGRALFESSRTGCRDCHSGFNFTSYAFENNGLYLEYPDPGRFRLTGLETDRARFKVPSLRNVARTAPYMHDGSVPTLEAVVDHYDSGGQAHPNKSALLRPLHLSGSEKAALIAFLHTLTDYEFVANPKFKP